MINGEVFTLSVPRLQALATSSYADTDIADGCATNTNYYTSGGSRSTCCCGCDKAALEE